MFQVVSFAPCERSGEDKVRSLNEAAYLPPNHHALPNRIVLNDMARLPHVVTPVRRRLSGTAFAVESARAQEGTGGTDGGHIVKDKPP